MNTPPKKPFVLIILDGFGCRDAEAYNPTKSAATPTLDRLFSEHPHLSIQASGEAVGLPEGQMGNSEVGHLHIGAGRKVPQDLVRIHQAIKTGNFFKESTLLKAFSAAKKNNAAVHVIGLLSDGGVHSHVDHIAATLSMATQQGIEKVYLHAITDGRDTPPQSALNYLSKIDSQKIVSVIGRYYAMDRDQRWDRTQKAYDLLTKGVAAYHAETAAEAIQNAYARGETDEFIQPTVIGTPVTLQENDILIFINFRADRARQLTHAIMDDEFSFFPREKKIHLQDYVTLTEYYPDDKISVVYPPISLKNTLGEYLSTQHKTQLRLAETEKYAHVTYFLNGGVETPYPGESRQLIPSPKVATYDLQPEMSAAAVTDALIAGIQSGLYDVLVCNYANPDMIGHTGNMSAAEESLKVIDHCLDRVLKALAIAGGEALITADHGNIECMYDPHTQQPHTAHTTNLVPLIYVGRPAYLTQNTGALDDVAPTLLYLMGLEKPADMTGHVLFNCE